MRTVTDLSVQADQSACLSARLLYHSVCLSSCLSACFPVCLNIMPASFPLKSNISKRKHFSPTEGGHCTTWVSLSPTSVVNPTAQTCTRPNYSVVPAMALMPPLSSRQSVMSFCQPWPTSVQNDGGMKWSRPLLHRAAEVNDQLLD